MSSSLKITISLKAYIKSIGLKSTITYVVQRYIFKSKFIILKIPQLKHKIKLRGKTTDIDVFRQIFIHKQFLFLKSFDLKTIIDCGANIGLTTIYMKHLFPKAKIICIEPEVKNFELLQTNTGYYKDIVLINKAVSNDCNGLYLTPYANREDSFQTKKFESQLQEGFKVESITISSIINEYNLKKLDFIKIDIEGAESYCITEDALDWINSTKILAIEIHDSIVPGCSFKIKNLLSKRFDYYQEGEYSVFTLNPNAN